nr:hypothetical protein [Aquisediminimonas profunda]
MIILVSDYDHPFATTGFAARPSWPVGPSCHPLIASSRLATNWATKRYVDPTISSLNEFDALAAILDKDVHFPCNQWGLEVIQKWEERAIPGKRFNERAVLKQVVPANAFECEIKPVQSLAIEASRSVDSLLAVNLVS